MFPAERRKEIERALRDTLDEWLPQLVHCMASATLRTPAPSPAPDAPPFTARQLEFIRLACHPAHYTRQQIAERMGITPHAVDKHCRAVYRKLAVQGRPALLHAALQLKIVEPMAWAH